ncbi:Gap repair protein with type I DNA topoisomerase domain [Catenovulum agarivorans DS-2]|uniref:Recombination protein RecR n=1 Tax=Catenovulum agarivorans DS-2 TaxID=1328313 RepID=W7QP73_9ALTE|nr:recombination mediator RecR [Catenovulum agarivorans]EWH09683.1 Gap repair protein with type I DNA topoisomerase domain [Catenovulum agarivorans DS-2]
MKFAPSLQQLIDALRVLPGVGPKSAQRMAFTLLEDNHGASQLAQSIKQAQQTIQSCQTCQNYTQSAQCDICTDQTRSANGQICVVAQPQDVLSIEQTGHYHGRYFVLKGLLSPIDGIGPEELGLDKLQSQLQHGINELILATSPSVEGEATAFYLSEMAKQYNITVTRLAQGLPAGGELSALDSRTLGHAFSGRKQL